MTHAFDYFVVFAEMRTGSNFLESNINTFPGLKCHGEAFNPHFIGYPNLTELLGVDQGVRDENPHALLAAVRADPKALSGFRFFNDHDPRVLDDILLDPRCAKIILTRNPMESYVSWKIAQATGQWKLTDVRRRKDSKIEFDAEEFEKHLSKLQRFQVFLLNTLQKSGQTAFYVAYDDLQDVEIMNGLAKFLGSSERIEALDDHLKRQNPSPLSEKVSNFDEVPAALASIDTFNISRTPNFEPRRGAAVPTYLATPNTGLIYMPVQAGPTDAVKRWMADLDGIEADALISKMNQRALRIWKDARQASRSFTVIRHPVLRAHVTFCQRFLSTGPGSFMKIRRTMRKRFKLPIPEEMPDPSYDLAAHRKAFCEYLKIIKATINGQTPIRQDGSWASQSSIVSGFVEFMPPDIVLREDELTDGLAALAKALAREDAPVFEPIADETLFSLAEIYDEQVEKLTRSAYQKDYEVFGFKDWA